MKWLAVNVNNKLKHVLPSKIREGWRNLWQTMKIRFILFTERVKGFMVSLRSKRRARWVKLNAYTRLDEINALDFMKAINEGSIKYLYKTGRVKYISYIAECFESMIDEYMRILGDKRYITYKDQQSKLIYIKHAHTNITAAMIVLTHRRSDKSLDVLKSYNLIPKSANKITDNDIRQITAQLKRWIVEAQIIEKGINNVFNDKPTGKKVDVMQVAFDYSITFSKWIGYKVELQSITAMEYAKMHSRYNEEIEQQRKMLEKNGR